MIIRNFNINQVIFNSNNKLWITLCLFISTTSFSFYLSHSNFIHKYTRCNKSTSTKKMSISDTDVKIPHIYFDNQNLRVLPVDSLDKDKNTDTRRSRMVSNAIFSYISPEIVINPRIIAISPSALKLLDYQDKSQSQGVTLLSELKENNKELTECFAGNKLLSGSETAAHCYAGHQFGNFAGQLGDGTVVYLGEIINHNQERWELQLKGN